MPIAPGTRFGPYEILAAAGAGGMGEVYRARDTRLDRDVALKVLPQHLSDNADLRARFEREAKALSALQHPHICTIHDVGNQDGTDYLVMEYLDGETLAERLEKGPLPLDQLLKVGADIADALDKAHRQGIIHRDLKPGNVMLTKAGAKLMDFGLAKPASISVTASATTPAFSAAVTRSSPASPITQQGTIVGTIQYMSPEQIEGKEADARSDIFGFGAVLYEMATGKRAFGGKSQLSVASAILEKEPEPVSALQPLTPPALEHVIATALAKDPAERFQSAHDLGIALGWVAASSGKFGPVGAPPTASSRRVWFWPAVAAIVAAIATTGIFLMRPAAAPEVLRASLLPPEKTTFQPLETAVSPDGKRLAFIASGESGTGIWIRHLAQGTSQLLRGTEGANFPFWSPDGKSVGFFAEAKLKRVAIDGGAIQTICEAADGRGGAWSEDDVILFAPDTTSELFRVSATGGKPEPVTKLAIERNDNSHRWPVFVTPQRFIYMLRGPSALGSGGIYIATLKAAGVSEGTLLVKSNYRAAYANGFLFWVQDDNLVAQQLDPKAGKLIGEPRVIAEQIVTDARWAAAFTVSADKIMYQSGVAGDGAMIWYDRQGKELSRFVIGKVNTFRLSPDGKKIAACLLAANRTTIWVYEIARGTKVRLTFADDDDPQWSSDGKQIIHDSTKAGHFDIYARPSDGSSEESLLYKSDATKYPTSWSRDGKYLAFDNNDARSATRDDVWVLPLEGDRKPFPFMATSASESFGEFSPDGKWLAYTSTESGRAEVYVAPFPEGKTRYLVSQDGGTFPRWRGDGKEIYYISNSLNITAVDVKPVGHAMDVGKATPLFRIKPVRPAYSYDVVPAGNRFLVSSVASENAAPMSVISNWAVELKKQ